MNGALGPPPGQNPARLPRMRHGLVSAELDDGMLIEGGPSRQFLTGAAASSLLPRLLPLLDGRHRPAEIRAALSLDAAQLDQALRLLGSRALIEWVPPDAGTGFASEQVATYLSRTIGLADGRTCVHDVADELALATVLIVAPPAVARPVLSDLSETGVANVVMLAAADVPTASAGLPGRCIAAVYDDPADEHVLEEVVAASRVRDLPVLRFSAATGSVEIGPFFLGPDTACVDCFRQGYESAGDGPAPLGPSLDTPARALIADDGMPDDGMTEALAGLVAATLLTILMSQDPAVPPRRLLRITLPDKARQAYDVVPDAECAICAGGTPPRDAESRDVLAYEWRMGKVPSPLASAGILSSSERDRLIALQRERDSLPSSPRHRLPDRDRIPALDAAGTAHRIGEPALAAILSRVAGFRPDTANSRWAPSGGNLASPTVYLITGSDLFGLPGTVVRYDDIEHQVVSVHADRVELGGILTGTGLDPARTELVLVLVGAVGRLRKKYYDFAWRLAHLDAGCAALQLCVVAAEYGLRTTFASAWPAALPEALEIDPNREVVMAMAGISADGNMPGKRGKGASPCQ
jgi:hypothetical protein